MKMGVGSAKRGQVSLVKGAAIAQSGVANFEEFARLVRGSILVYDPTDRMRNSEAHWAYWKDVIGCPTTRCVQPNTTSVQKE